MSSRSTLGTGELSEWGIHPIKSVDSLTEEFLGLTDPFGCVTVARVVELANVPRQAIVSGAMDALGIEDIANLNAG
jgi:hypothetical protein